MLLREFRVTREQLDGLKKYKYSSSTSSLIDNNFLLPAFWNLIQKRLPRNLSPNLITLAGFLVNALGFAPLVLYSFDLSDPRPLSLLLLAVSCGFFYNTCDNLDGMHARALGVGSVVGELFDHGLDSMANVFQLFPVVMALEMIKLDFYFILALFLLTESYSLLFFSRKLAVGTIQFQMVDTTEIQYTSFLGVAITLLLGYNFWDITLPIPGISVSLPTLRFIFGVVGSFPLLSNSIVQLINQLKSPNRSTLYYVYVQCVFIWIYSFVLFEIIPSAKTNCMVYFIMIGGCYSKLITEVVFMGAGTKPTRSWLRTETLAPLMLIANQYLNLVEPTLAAVLSAVFTVALWYVYFWFVVYKAASFLNLPVLTVPMIKKK